LCQFLTYILRTLRAIVQTFLDHTRSDRTALVN
jgi:hypothetical protein